MSASLLIELFTEELPPKALRTLGKSFADGIAKGLEARGLVGPSNTVSAFATPRRLAARLSEVLNKSPDRAESKKLMPVKVAFDADGKPSTALVKRLQKEGYPTEVDIRGIVERRTEGNTEFLFLIQVASGQSLQVALLSALEETIEKLPIPKLMSYQLADGTTTVQFVRPAHGLVALHGSEPVSVSVLGLEAGRLTHGHRFQGAAEIELAAADEYEGKLAAQGGVIADFDQRKSMIEQELQKLAEQHRGSLGRSADYLPVLDEVTALVEYPTVYAGTFDPTFLAVPPECLILTMRQNQKYFPLFDATGALTNRFLMVSNMRLDDPRNIIEGNQRVIRPRLADARFFFETDKKIPLAERVPQLAHVVYHNKLGTQFDRVERLRALARTIAQRIGSDPKLAERAALLSKADLVTNMVGEFPELQGIMGRYYALADGEDARVADAIEGHYRPRFSGDELPAHDLAMVLAIADRVDTLIGIWGIGLQPTGEKDPFGLRRAALGVLRMLAGEPEAGLALDLDELLDAAAAGFPAGKLAPDTKTEVRAFLLDRLRSYLRERGYEPNEIEAVLADNPARIDLVLPRIEAVRAFRLLPDAAGLAAANKRARDILRKEGFSEVRAPKAELLVETAERALAEAIVETRAGVDAHYERNEYVDCLKKLSGMRAQVDAFFEQVLVNAEDPAVRANRLALLSELSYLLNRVADISKLAA